MERERGGEEAAFWLRHAHVGIVMGGLGLALVLAYVLVTGDRPARAGLAALVGAMTAGNLGLLALPLRRLVADRRGRALLFRPWTTATVIGIAGGAVLDGGADSPLWWLALLVLIHAASIYSPRATVGLGAATMALYCLVAVLGPPVPGDRSLVVGGVLAMVTLLAALTSGNI